MLVLSRKRGEDLVIDGCIVVRILSITPNNVKLGIASDNSRQIPIDRYEVAVSKMEEGEDWAVLRLLQSTVEAMDKSSEAKHVVE